MKVLEYMKSHLLVLDGGMGTLLQKRGLSAGEKPEVWNITHPEVIREIHESYFKAGSRVVSTNTFGANCLKYGEDELRDVIFAAVRRGTEAREATGVEGFVALDVGPTGKLLKPLGDLDFEEAVEVFAKTVRLGVEAGVDLILIETMNDLYEAKAALLAAKENSSLPVFVSCAFGEDGCLMTGADPEAVVATLEGLGADAIGVNCSFGPKLLAPVVKKMLEVASVPVLLKPNAGLPTVVCGECVYDLTPEDFAAEVSSLVEAGVRVVGGCCGTTPEYIAALADVTADAQVKPVTEKNLTWVASNTHAVKIENEPLLIGERINPTGKKRLKAALRDGEISYLISEALAQKEKGVHILDVNVGLPELDEVGLLNKAVCEIQTVCDLPLQLDTSNPKAMEAALRRYCGRAMINSVCGKDEVMRAVFPLVKKYGGTVVALTLDENGIPETAEGRLEIARRIVDTAAKYGISKKDIVFDTLTMTVSTDPSAARVTLRALERVKRELGCHTVLGVSNVSFGLPSRDTVNSAFFTCAMERGLSAAIMNPYSEEMMRAYYSFKALHGFDGMCADYISYMEGKTSAPPVANSGEMTLREAVVKGIREVSAETARRALQLTDPMALVENELIPALDEVGRGFEEKKVYLPQLLMSAEAAKAAFGEVSAVLSKSGSASGGEDFVIATVKGDVHDIGKNIVALLLGNYGFTVHDLGRDVAPEAVVEAVKRTGAKIVGLSALMTTTVPAMEETIACLRREAPECKVIVGGAVLTEEYAEQIGADFYAADAMATVRIAKSIV